VESQPWPFFFLREIRMSDLILGANEALVFPSGNGTDQPIVLDLRPVFTAEARLVELHHVTRTKGGELLRCFIEAYRDARQALGRAQAQLVIAKRKVKEAKAEVILDKAVDALKAKGLITTRSPSGSEDLRDSVVTRDPGYQAVVERMEKIEAAVSFLETKTEVMKMAYFAVNKLIDPVDRQTNMSGGSGTDEPGAFTDAERITEFVQKQTVAKPANYAGTGFGAPKL
jgi:hypothetical protein